MAKRVFSVRGGILQGGLESLARNKANRLGRLDLDFVTRLRIDARPCFACSNFECTKADQLDGFGFFDAEFDSINHCIHSALSLGFADVFTKSLLHCCDEFDFVHM